MHHGVSPDPPRVQLRVPSIKSWILHGLHTFDARRCTRGRWAWRSACAAARRADGSTEGLALLQHEKKLFCPPRRQATRRELQQGEDRVIAGDGVPVAARLHDADRRDDRGRHAASWSPAPAGSSARRSNPRSGASGWPLAVLPQNFPDHSARNLHGGRRVSFCTPPRPEQPADQLEFWWGAALFPRGSIPERGSFGRMHCP